MALEVVRDDEPRSTERCQCHFLVGVRKRAWSSDIQGKEKFQSLMAPTSLLPVQRPLMLRGAHTLPMLVGFEHGKEGEYGRSASEVLSVVQRVLEWKLRMNGQVSSHGLYVGTVGQRGQ
jgi:hypothetical protein